MRPRGFADWKPRQDRLDLLASVREIIDQYATVLTIRQIFYRLVGRYNYAKTEKAYKNLCEMLNRARRAGLIPMEAIRDDSGADRYPFFYQDADDFWESTRRNAEYFRLDRQRGQPQRLVVMCEAAGMVEQLFQISEPYGIEALSGGGFDSTSNKHRLGELWAREGRPVCVLRIGDYDASGVAMSDNIAEDIGAFTRHYGGTIEVVEVAITREQAELHGLQSAPPKTNADGGLTDYRPANFNDTETWQAEALDPDDLARYLEAAILDRLDRAIYDALLDDEEAIRNQLIAELEE